MNIYSFTWVEMSGGFDQECNILAESKEKSIEIYKKELGHIWRNFDESLKSGSNLHVKCLNEVYTHDYLTKLNKHIHYTQNA